MKKIGTWMYYTFSATCFTMSGIINYTEESYTSSKFLIVAGVSLFGLASKNYKHGDAVVKPLTNEETKKIDLEVKPLLEAGEKMKAIKKYRAITGH